MTSTILALDPAISTGFCLVKITNDIQADIYREGYIQVDNSSDYQGDHCIDLMNQLSKIIEEEEVNMIIIEDYFFSRKTCNGSNVNAAFRTAIHILARSLKIPYYIVNISAWKTFVAGRSTPTKEQKKKWGGKPAKKLYIQDALWKKYKFKFPNHSISENTGNPIIFRNDIIDVVAQAVYYCGLVRGIRDITRSVIVPDDIVFKKPPKKLYKYEEF